VSEPTRASPPAVLDSEYEGLFAEFYDFLHAGQTVDVAVFTELAEERGGPALEIGCGTGRVLAPLAGAGIGATGIDASRDMLALCARKLRSMPEDARPHLVLADMRRFSLRGRYGLALMVCNTLWHCRSDEDALAAFRCAREHLAPDGRFVLDVCLPDLDLWAETSGTTETLRVPDPEGRRDFVSHFTPTYDPERLIERDRIVLREMRGGRIVRSAECEIELRHYRAEEIRDLLARAGLEIREEWGTFKRTPLRPGSREGIFVSEAYSPR
jgi:SAM-dependent methyltransferase